jgi:hypothetical protein
LLMQLGYVFILFKAFVCSSRLDLWVFAILILSFGYLSLELLSGMAGWRRFWLFGVFSGSGAIEVKLGRLVLAAWLELILARLGVIVALMIPDESLLLAHNIVFNRLIPVLAGRVLDHVANAHLRELLKLVDQLLLFINLLQYFFVIGLAAFDGSASLEVQDGLLLPLFESIRTTCLAGWGLLFY